MFKQTPADEYLTPIATNLFDEREKAIEKRKSQGLDAIWQKAREQFQGIDNVNRPGSPEGLQTMDDSAKLTGFKSNVN